MAGRSPATPTEPDVVPPDEFPNPAKFTEKLTSLANKAFQILGEPAILTYPATSLCHAPEIFVCIPVIFFHTPPTL